MRARFVSVAVLAAALVFSCGTPDHGVVADAGQGGGAGGGGGGGSGGGGGATGQDSGAEDGGADAGNPAVDAGDDAGVTVDAGAIDDAGTDAGQPPDSGIDAGACANILPPVTLVDVPSAVEVPITGEPGDAGYGRTDPYFVYPDDGGAGVLVYSVAPFVVFGDVFTRVATSSDQGTSFQYAAAANSVTAASVLTTDPSVCDAGVCSGRLVHEVPTLVEDPTDPNAQRHYKLFTHSYLETPGNNAHHYDIGYIGLWTAPAPGGPWSTETKSLGWNSSSPFSSNGAATNLSSISQLNDCVAFSEPGAVEYGGTIDIALACVYRMGSVSAQRIVLLRSTNHAQSFSYVNTLLNGQDALCVGNSRPEITGSALFIANGKHYLSATPDGPIANPANGVGHEACLTFEFQDPAAGTLKRNAGGAPVVLRKIQASDGRRTGACTYAAGATNAGYLVPMAYYDQLPRFLRIITTTLPAP